MLSKGVVADLMPFNSAERFFGTPEQDARYLHYVIARYAAYPNVIWCVTNEFQRTGRSQDYMNILGRMIRDSDAWMANGDALRGLSIHPLGGKGKGDFFKFGQEAWPVHVILQTGRMDPADVPLNAEILNNRQFHMPVVDDEFGYIGDSLWHNAEGKRGKDTNYYSREKHRNALWSIYMAGGYGTTGDKVQHEDGKPYKTGLWHDEPEYADVRALSALFTTKQLRWWEMQPDNALSKGKRVYVLALEGRQYILYAAIGGKIELRLPPGKFSPTLFNPRDGSETRLPAVTGGEAHFSTPANSDWVIYLKRR
jgi:hypothetical protein